MMSIADWFSSSGNAALAAFFISLISVFVAAAALYTSCKTQKRQVEIEEIREKDRQREMRKADLVARLEDENGRDLLVIENKGAAEARDVMILINGRPLYEYRGFLRGEQEIRSVGPFSSFHYLMALTMGMDPFFEITISWVDDSGEAGRYNTTLTY
ncbi:MAG: hypothetical protein KBB04_09765 [Methanothrix sp.]|uniref:hypothetical protein n=1 Tax=Methanothrix sp. TaxID=90426 RepID=UPI001B65100F|nr:hypothetical protein [Methanothrix sp.]MBP7068544.1 hypothetical protein [Methanothrix sp.]